MTVLNYNQPDRALENLHPKMASRVNLMLHHPGLDIPEKTGFKHFSFKVFEAFRHPARQNYLLGTTPPVTKAGPWQSSHQYGLAVDFAGFWINPDGTSGWSWDPALPWQRLKAVARACDLDIPIEWDMGHVEHPEWPRLRQHLISNDLW